MERLKWMSRLACLRFFLGGIENYIIAPTAWYYIRSLGLGKFFLALVLTAYNVASMFAAPLFGFLTDHFGRPKLFFVITNITKVLSSVLYCVNLNGYFPLLGRFVSGIGSVATTILLGQVALLSGREERGKIFVFLEGAYCLGSAVGPALGSFVSFNVNLLGWKINAGNSPGIVLTFIWLVFAIISCYFPSTMWAETGDRSKELARRPSVAEAEQELLGKEEDAEMESSRFSYDSRILCLLFLVFNFMFSASAATFFAPILAQDHFHLEFIHTKLLFLNCTMFTLLLFISLTLASGRVDERKLLMFALFVQISSILFLTLIAFLWDENDYALAYVLLLYTCLGMPYFGFPIGNSILSKITDRRCATFVQGISFAVLNISYISSRVAVSFVFTKTSMICFSLTIIGTWIIGTLWFGFLYKKMTDKK